MSSLQHLYSEQLSLPFVRPHTRELTKSDVPYSTRLRALLQSDLDFRGENSAYASHNFHAFPAKFPPQLPALFIEYLTRPGDAVLDPMAGSGTTLVEAVIADRIAVGCDIDPLALMISKVKTTPLDYYRTANEGYSLLTTAKILAKKHPNDLWKIRENWHQKTRNFVDYWFMPQTQLELLALGAAIGQLTDRDVRAFFRLIFSSIIITKSGGVSLARDLAHTRPHRAKIIYAPTGQVLEGENLIDEENPRLAHISKTITSPFVEFEKRLSKTMRGVKEFAHIGSAKTLLLQADAQALPLHENAVDLIITSPPYASNAIDYMRAHKFSLIWFGYPIETLSRTRKKYVGGEATTNLHFETLPPFPARIVREISALDKKKGAVLHRYYSEMKRTLREMHRVLKPGRAAIVVVGSSVMRNKDTETGQCLADIGESVGFELAHIGIRYIDRDKRMMPTSHQIDHQSQIQRRMHREFVVGFIK